MTTQYFDSTMSGVPTLSASAGSLNAFLKTMLPILGWTIEYDSGSGVVVYRNDPSAPGSSGCYVRVDNTTSAATLKVYKTMSDIDTGTEGVPNSTAYMYSTNGSWQLIGDERTVYLNVAISATISHRLIFAFGDYTSLIPGDEYNYFASGWSSSTYPSNVHNPDGSFASAVTSATRESARNASLTPDTRSRFFTLGYRFYCSGNTSGLPLISGQVILKPFVMYSSEGAIGLIRGCYCLETVRTDSFFCEYAVSGFDLPLKGFNFSGGGGDAGPGGVAFSQENWS